VPEPGFQCGSEWERKWRLRALALARKRDTILHTLSLRRKVRAGSALLGRPGRLDFLALDRRVGSPCRDSCLVVVRFWESTVCLEEIRIDPSIYDGVFVVDVVVVDDVDEFVVEHCRTPDPEVAVAFLDRSWPTFRCCAVCMYILSCNAVTVKPQRKRETAPST
jgi:hypothetical protein